MIEFPRDLKMAPNTGEWTVCSGAGFSRYAIQAWLCWYFDPRYDCDAVVVCVPDIANHPMEHVSRLKGVKWTVVVGKLEPEALTQWRARFRRATIMTRDESTR